MNALPGLTRVGESPELMQLLGVLISKMAEAESEDELRVDQVLDVIRSLKAFTNNDEAQPLIAALISKVRHTGGDFPPDDLGLTLESEIQPEEIASTWELFAALGPPPPPPTPPSAPPPPPPTAPPPPPSSATPAPTARDGFQ